MKHRFSLYGLVLLASILSGTLGANPTPIEPGLLNDDSAIALHQSDFASGTFRIRKPGYYYLAENIKFDPNPAKEANRNDKPVHGGWFAAISIETDNVVLDLNTKTLECTQNFVDNHLFKVFCMVELNNSPFPHFVFAFNGETELKNAHNVVIRNGVLGRCPHHGIHGNSNSNIQLYDLTIKDWEVAGISLNGLKNGNFENIQISGLEHPVPFTGMMTLLHSTLKVLQQLAHHGWHGSHEHIYALEHVICDPERNGVHDAKSMHDGNAYGILLNHTLNVGPQPFIHGHVTTDCIALENVTVCNIKSDIIETVGMKDLQGKLLKGPVFGVLRWFDAYSGSTFAPNEILRAQVFATNAMDPGRYPDGFADNILADSPDEATFLSQVEPSFNHDFAGHTNKGVFGIRVDVSHCISLKNCNVCTIENSGCEGHTLETIPAGENFTEEPGRYTGNDVFGIALAGSHSCTIDHCTANNCGSLNGFVKGVALFNDSSANKVFHTCSNGHFGLGDLTGSEVNPPSIVSGFFVDKASDANTFVWCQSRDLHSKRFSHGFSVEDSRGNSFEHCDAAHNVAFSSEDLSKVKEAIGFRAHNTICTLFDHCEGSNMVCTDEDEAQVSSSSHALGFFVDGEDRDSSVINSFSRSNFGGAGVAAGMQLDGSDLKTVVRNNQFCNHQSDLGLGEGFGLLADDGDTLLVIQNLAYGNQTENFEVLSGTQPTVEVNTYPAVTDLDKLGDGCNVGIERP